MLLVADLARPKAVLGPVDFCALERFAARAASVIVFFDDVSGAGDGALAVAFADGVAMWVS